GQSKYRERVLGAASLSLRADSAGYALWPGLVSSVDGRRGESVPRMSVGFPATLWLQEFGSQVWSAFGEPPYHVGSSFEKKDGWRDVDVRLVLDDEEYERL